MTFSIRLARAAMAIAVPGAIALPLAMTAAPAAASEASDMAKFRAHLSGVQSMTAKFTQTDGRGRASAGSLQLKKPGRVRFQYGSGDLLLVANNGKLNFIDYQVGQKSSWALNKTPLGVLLSPNPNLKGRATIVPSKDPNVVVVRARDPNQFGTLILAFIRSASAPGGLMLYGWTAIDAQNKKTTVKLSNQRYNVAIPEGAFTFKEPKKRGR